MKPGGPNVRLSAAAADQGHTLDPDQAALLRKLFPSKCPGDMITVTPFEALPLEDQVFFEKTRAEGHAPFDEDPPWRRKEAAWFVRAVTGERGAEPRRRRPLTRRRGAGRPAFRGACRRSSAASGDSGDGEPHSSPRGALR